MSKAATRCDVSKQYFFQNLKNPITFSKGNANIGKYSLFFENFRKCFEKNQQFRGNVKNIFDEKIKLKYRSIAPR